MNGIDRTSKRDFAFWMEGPTALMNLIDELGVGLLRMLLFVGLIRNVGSFVSESGGWGGTQFLMCAGFLCVIYEKSGPRSSHKGRGRKKSQTGSSPRLYRARCRGLARRSQPVERHFLVARVVRVSQPQIVVIQPPAAAAAR